MEGIFWGKDAAARARVAPRLIDGKLNGRHLIEHDTRISGGIYINAPDHEVPLDNFIKLGIGDCRAFALLAGSLTERLTDMLLLLGTVNVDRNMIQDRGGHAWVRYKDFFGKVTIIDAPNQYLGDEISGLWAYKRPEA
jgi:hypothetical protein